MNHKIKNLLPTALMVAGIAGIFSSCTPEVSSVSGWTYNDSKNGGFQVTPYEEQETGPGLVLIEGGSFTMGRVEQDVLYDWNNVPRRITVSSFYMDETEITNINYLEYLYWTMRVYGADYPEVYKKALPDTLVWREKLAFNEPYVEYYLRHPAYHYYPVVGVNWLQANDFCVWRTDRVNEFILIREGLLDENPNQVNEDNFNVDAYLAGQYEGAVIDNMPDLNPSSGGERKVRMEDGIFLPRYRLPTEAEWEFAAFGLIGATVGERVTERRLYPWGGHGVRNSDERYIGDMFANFKRGRGDNMGIAGALNDNADVTAPVYSYWPNDYGLYNMAGNVSEWVMDVYRPISQEDVNDFRAFRGSDQWRGADGKALGFSTFQRDEEGAIAEKDSLGHLTRRAVTEEENLDRRNYRKADNINFLDGDINSSIYYAEGEGASSKGDKLMYEWKQTSMINDEARVYKGGSWKDRAYWMVPGTRRFLDEKQSTPWLGFRCAMTRVGSPTGLGH